MKPIFRNTALILLAVLYVPVHSDPVEKLDSEVVDCKNAVITAEVALCANLKYRRSDRRLNKVYTHIMASLDKEGHDAGVNYSRAKASLVDAQRAWVKFRDTDCEALHLATAGTISNIKKLGCLQDRTKQRTKELEQFDRAL